MEDDARAIILRLVFGDDEQDGWKLLVDTARHWNAFLAENPPSDEDDTFFSGSFIAENPRRKQFKPKKVNEPDHGELVLLYPERQDTEGMH